MVGSLLINMKQVFFLGDYISITGMNNEKGINAGDAAGFFATFHYQLLDRKTTTITKDDKNWKCDGKRSYSFGK